MSSVVQANLEAIVIRCREGDKRSDWLPVIDRLATEALEHLTAPDLMDALRESVERTPTVRVPLEALRELIERARDTADALDGEYSHRQIQDRDEIDRLVAALGVEGLEA